MLADELDYVIGVDTHRDRHVLAVVAAPTGALIAQRSVETNARGYSKAVRFAERHAPGARVWAIEGAGHYGAGPGPLPGSLAARSARESAGAAVPSGGSAARTTRSTQSAPPARRSHDETASPAIGTAAGSSTSAVAGPPQRRRRPPGRTRPAAERDRDRTRGATQATAAAPRRRARSPLQPLPSLELADTRPARNDHRTRCARAAHPGATVRSRRARTRDPRARPRTRPDAPRRARHRPDRRRSADRDLVTPRPRQLRGRLRPPRRRRPLARLERSHDPPPPQPRRRPPTQPRPPHRHPPPPTARPRDEGLHRPPHQRRQKHPRRRSGYSSATSPATSTASCKTRAHSPLDSHRSFIPASLAQGTILVPVWACLNASRRGGRQRRRIGLRSLAHSRKSGVQATNRRSR